MLFEGIVDLVFLEGFHPANQEPNVLLSVITYH